MTDDLQDLMVELHEYANLHNDEVSETCQALCMLADCR